MSSKSSILSRQFDETLYNEIIFQIQRVQKKITDTFKTADDVDHEIDRLHKMRLHARNTMSEGPYRPMVLAEITKCKRALIVARETLLENAQRDVQQDAQRDTQRDTQQEARDTLQQEAPPASIYIEMVK